MSLTYIKVIQLIKNKSRCLVICKKNEMKPKVFTPVAVNPLKMITFVLKKWKEHGTALTLPRKGHHSEVVELVMKDKEGTTR